LPAAQSSSSSPLEAEFAKRYDFIVSDLVRRTVMPDDVSDEDETMAAALTFHLPPSDGGIKYWHEGKNQTKAIGGAASKTRYTAAKPIVFTAVNSSGTAEYGKNTSSGLQYRPEITPHMNATGKFPAYYPQVCGFVNQ
jgi:hypothetical protein